MPEQSATAPALTLRAGTADDTDRILELAKLSLGEGSIPRYRAYWDWKHIENPFGESPVLLAEADGQLVGLRVFMRWDWIAGGQTYRAVRAVDTATHPDWQGRGIFSRLTKALVQQVTDEGVHFIFNTPNEKSRPGYLKMGWQAVGRTDLWIRPLRPLRLAGGLMRRRQATPLAQSSPQAWPESRSLDDLCRHPHLEAFLAAQRDGAEPRLTTPLSSSYLRWRYHAIPGFEYRTVFEIDGEGGAALVFRFKEQGQLTELRVCELLVGKGRASRRTASRLLGHVLSEAEADYAAIMAAPRTAAMAAARRKLFLPAMRLGPILTVRQLNPVHPNLELTSRQTWRASIGDLELF